MGYVTSEQISRARQYPVLNYVLTYESNNVKRVGSGYRLKDHESIAISDKGFYWHSKGIGGKTALDFLTEIRGYGLVEAVCMLIGERPYERGDKPPTVTERNRRGAAAFSRSENREESITPRARPPTPSAQVKPPPERIPFAMPLRNKDNKRVIAYLQSRGIDRDSIMDCIQKGSLYESATYHNAVFTGKDENGKTRFAALRGTTSSFKRDADGSDKRYGFVLPPDNPNSHKIAVFEAPIDCLSHQTLCKKGFIPPFDGWRLSLGGTSILALEHFISLHPEVTHCLICTDNDEAGRMASRRVMELCDGFTRNGSADQPGEKAAARIAELPEISSERSPPVMENDWNDVLRSFLKAERTHNRTRQNNEQHL